MDEMTAAQVIKVILWICAAITSVGAAVTVIVKAVTAAKAPTKQLEQRIGALEDKVDKHEEFFGNDKKRLDGIEEGSRVTQRAILALLSHGIDGNDVAGLRAAKDELQQYLINR